MNTQVTDILSKNVYRLCSTAVAVFKSPLQLQNIEIELLVKAAAADNNFQTLINVIGHARIVAHIELVTCYFIL